MNDVLLLVVSGLIAWCAVLTRVLLSHRALLALARRRTALGLKPFLPAPDDNPDRQYLNRKGRG